MLPTFAPHRKASLKPTLRTNYYRLAGFVNAGEFLSRWPRSWLFSRAKILAVTVGMVAWVLLAPVLVNRSAVAALAWFKSEFVHVPSTHTLGLRTDASHHKVKAGRPKVLRPPRERLTEVAR